MLSLQKSDLLLLAHLTTPPCLLIEQHESSLKIVVDYKGDISKSTQTKVLLRSLSI